MSSSDRYDVIIIGTGAGGGTYATGGCESTVPSTVPITAPAMNGPALSCASATGIAARPRAPTAATATRVFFMIVSFTFAVRDVRSARVQDRAGSRAQE